MSKGYEEKELPPPYTPTPSQNYSPPDYDPSTIHSPYNHHQQQQQRNPQPSAPPHPMPYVSGNDASSSRGSVVGSIGQAAFSMVSSIINNRLEHRQQKHEKRQMRRERRSMRKGKGRDTQYSGGPCDSSYQNGCWQNGFTQQQQQQQHASYGQSRNMGCGNTTWFKDEKETNGEYQAHGVNDGHHSSGSDSDSTDGPRYTSEKLDIKRKNMSFEFNENWFGKECSINTSNGNLQLHGTLEATDYISLKSSNGSIIANKDLVARNSISIEGSNGPFVMRGQTIISKDISIKISNSPLNFDSMIQGERVKLKTSNSPIILKNITVTSELTVKTSCSPIEIYIDDLGPKAELNIETSMAPVNVYLPRSFAGEFNLKTSLSSAEVVAKSEGADVTIDKDEGTSIKGACTKYGQKGNAKVTIKTSLAKATLYL